MLTIVFVKTHCPIIFNEEYSIVEEACKPAIEAQNRQQVLAGASVGT